MPIDIKPEDRLEIVFSEEERDTILKNSDLIDAAIRSKLVFGVHHGNDFAYRLSVQDLFALAEGLANALDIAKDQKSRRALEGILGHMGDVLRPIIEPLMEDQAEPPEDWEESAPLAEIAEEYMRSHPDATLDELNEYMQVEVAKHNREPIEEFNGLSPMQMGCLFSCPDQSVILNEQLPDEMFRDIRVVRETLNFLEMFAEGKVKATQTGNLNRRFLKEVPEKVYPDGEIPMQYWTTGTRNELSMWSIHILRLLVTEAGYLRKYRGHFLLTKRGQKLLETRDLAPFYARLFWTLFTRLDLSYVARCIEWPEFQGSIFYSIAVLDRIGGEWQDEFTLTEQVVFPLVLENLPYVGGRPADIPWLVHAYLWRPLAWFGLMEKRVSEDSELQEDFAPMDDYRTTPFWHKLISFSYSEDMLRSVLATSANKSGGDL